MFDPGERPIEYNLGYRADRFTHIRLILKNKILLNKNRNTEKGKEQTTVLDHVQTFTLTIALLLPAFMIGFDVIAFDFV